MRGLVAVIIAFVVLVQLVRAQPHELVLLPTGPMPAALIP